MIRRNGFTLVELLVSLAILSLIAAAITAPFASTIRSRDRAEASMERLSALRSVVSRMEEELESVVITTAAGPAAAAGTPGPTPTAQASGASNSTRRAAQIWWRGPSTEEPATEIRFETRSARRAQGGPMPPISVVEYRLEPAQDSKAGYQLIKRQRALLSKQEENVPEWAVLDQVETFRVVFRKGATILPPNQANSQEPAIQVEIQVTLMGENDTGESLRTVVNLE